MLNSFLKSNFSIFRLGQFNTGNSCDNSSAWEEKF